jgi:hypothetical protein
MAPAKERDRLACDAVLCCNGKLRQEQGLNVINLVSPQARFLSSTFVILFSISCGQTFFKLRHIANAKRLQPFIYSLNH